MRPPILKTARRALRKPPRVVLRRAAAELGAELERLRAPWLIRKYSTGTLLSATEAESLDDLWSRVVTRAPFRRAMATEALDALVPGESARVLERAELAVALQVDLLGSGPTALDLPIDWHRDFKTGHAWPPAFFRSIDYVNLDRDSDVKVPWELSRAHWLIPAGQAYVLTGDERYARAVRSVLDDWISANPYAGSVNWAVAMEAAMRIFSWSWLAGAFGESDAWRDEAFRLRFLRSLYLHGVFTHRHIERSDVNGNHYTADAAALSLLGTVLNAGAGPTRWRDRGWSILLEELPQQVHSDGVDFEASTAYHRLVAELFLLPALHRESVGLEVPDEYRERVRLMARFTAAYTRLDRSPAWGDADDARALPLGGTPPDDHRHLTASVAAAWGDAGLRAQASGGLEEAAWLLGVEPAQKLGDRTGEVFSTAFSVGGVYILAAGSDHVFVDCGPVGLAGRGGHGHNDCLAVDAVLCGAHLLTDAGSYVYTASPEWRNRFRSTASHNTPEIDGAEQNRFVDGSLWLLHDDAKPEVREWRIADDTIRFQGAHTGYQRLAEPVTPVRTVILEPAIHRLTIQDEFEGDGEHRVSIPLQLAPGVAVDVATDCSITLTSARAKFDLRWRDSELWSFEVRDGWVSPSYGIKLQAPRLEWLRVGDLRPLRVEIEPAA
jgi:hypothetical protein